MVEHIKGMLNPDTKWLFNVLWLYGKSDMLGVLPRARLVITTETVLCYQSYVCKEYNLHWNCQIRRLKSYT